MADHPIVSYKKFGLDSVQDKLSSTDKNNSLGVEIGNGETNFTEESGEFVGIDSGYYDSWFYQDKQVEKDTFIQPIQPQEREYIKINRPCEIKTSIEYSVEPKKEKRDASSLDSLRLLRSCGNGFKRMSRKRMLEYMDDTQTTEVVGEELSTIEIMRIAGEKFIRSSMNTGDIVSMLNNPFDLSFSGLADDDMSRVELVELLLAIAEKVGNQQYERASKLLNECDSLCSKTGNPLQRVSYYFCQALRERIDRVTGRIMSQDMRIKNSRELCTAHMVPSAESLAYYQKIPFNQVDHLAGIQVVTENVLSATKIHVIDFNIRTGVQWTVLMQALGARCDFPIELLKVTNVSSHPQNLTKAIGERLTEFARTIGLPFSYNVIMVSDMLDLKEDLLDLDPDETRVIYFDHFLRILIPSPDRLDYMMKVIRNLNPCVMIVTDAETNHGSPNFISRFVEAFFYFGAYFDCLDAFMEPNDPNRMLIESIHFGSGIRIIVATEGEERKVKNVKVDVWRTYFARFGLEEMELSSSALYTANLVLRKFPKGNSCTLDVVGKSLVKGWKGVPLHSLSAWKFMSEEEAN